MIELKAYVGKDNSWPLQIPALGETTLEPATTFEAADALFCTVWEGQSQAPIFSTAAEWFQQVTALNLTSGGSGYSPFPTVAITGGGATSNATAYAIVVGGVITRFVMTDGGADYDGSPVTVTITDSTGTGATATATVLLGWQIGLVALEFTAAQSSLLAPGGTYQFQISATRGTISSVVIDGLIQALATPGAGVLTLPDLVSYDYVESRLKRIKLKDDEVDSIPDLTAAASEAIRKWCGQRDFTRRSYSEEYGPQQNGCVYLRQMPVNSVTRIRGSLQTALSITASDPTFSSAYVQWTTTGDWSSGTLTFTGISLVSYAAGVQTSTPFLFANYPTVQALATAITATPGWIARVTGNLGAYGSADLAAASSGTSQGAMAGNNCDLQVYSDDLPCTDLENATGMLWVGQRSAPAFGSRWGDDGGDLGESSGCGRVRVDYNAGFDVIPAPIKLACAELVKFKIMMFRRDELLKSETAQKYSYEITQDMVKALPVNVLEGISRYVIHHAS